MLPSLAAARLRFDECARLEPRLTALWTACAEVAQPERVGLDDPFDFDPFAEEPLEDDWCTEDHFFRYIKPQLLPLIGWQRRGDPAELQTSEAYDAVFTALFHVALHRTCDCCREQHKSAA